VNIILSSVVGLILIGLGAFLYLSFRSGSELDPTAAKNVLVTLRKLPSSEQGLSVDEKMNAEVKKSKDAGKLIKYEGWTMRPVKGDKNKILIAFTFEEKESGWQRAEWIADTTNNSFAPRTGLASAIYTANNTAQ